MNIPLHVHITRDGTRWVLHCEVCESAAWASVWSKFIYGTKDAAERNALRGHMHPDERTL